MGNSQSDALDTPGVPAACSLVGTAEGMMELLMQDPKFLDDRQGFSAIGGVLKRSAFDLVGVGHRAYWVRSWRRIPVSRLKLLDTAGRRLSCVCRQRGKGHREGKVG